MQGMPVGLQVPADGPACILTPPPSQAARRRGRPGFFLFLRSPEHAGVDIISICCYCRSILLVIRPPHTPGPGSRPCYWRKQIRSRRQPMRAIAAALRGLHKHMHQLICVFFCSGGGATTDHEASQSLSEHGNTFSPTSCGGVFFLLLLNFSPH
jgi:hypothetical protein